MLLYNFDVFIHKNLNGNQNSYKLCIEFNIIKEFYISET